MVMEVKISNGRCKACDVEFGAVDYKEDLCTKCLTIAMDTAHGKQKEETFMELEDEAAYEKIMESYAEYQQELDFNEGNDEWI